MSYAAYVDEKFAADVASNSGWATFCRWAGSLEFHELLHLTQHGWSQELSQLAEDLRQAIRRGKPVPDVRSVAVGVYRIAKRGGDVLVVTDGVGIEASELPPFEDSIVNHFGEFTVFSEHGLTMEELSQVERSLFFEEFVSDDWAAYNGPRGGKGWRNTRTGVVVYGPKRGGDAAASPPTKDGGGKSGIKQVQRHLSKLHEAREKHRTRFDQLGRRLKGWRNLDAEDRDRIKAQRRELKGRMDALAARARKTFDKAVRASKPSEFDTDTGSTPTASRRIEKVVAWVENMFERRQGAQGPMYRLYFVQVSARASFAGGRLDIGQGTHADIAHEMGHYLEYAYPKVGEACRRFLKKRVGEDEPVSLKKIQPGCGYQSWELGRKDDFEKLFGDGAWYVGKHYDDGETEILSMGLEALWRNPAEVATRDPDYFFFLVGVLRGRFR